MKKLDKTIFVDQAKQLGIKPKVAVELFKLVMSSAGQVTPTKKKGNPKLASVLNPRSKYYDSTPRLTEKLSLAFKVHQHKRGRYHHERITSQDRQWVLLVQIKLAIVEVVGIRTSEFLSCARRVFIEAEQLSKRSGKDNLYLTIVLGNIGEILDTVGIKSSITISIRDNRLYRAYRIRRRQASGMSTLNKVLEVGSVEHNFIRQMSTICRKYRVKAKLFMDIQFAAFAQFDSFPALKDLVTSKAIDRLERGLMKYRKDSLGKEDDAYWQEIENKSGR